MKSAPILSIDRHIYRELAKLTQSPKLRMVYAKMNARIYLREKKNRVCRRSRLDPVERFYSSHISVKERFSQCQLNSNYMNYRMA